MRQITLSGKEVERLKKVLNELPLETPVTLEKMITSEYGESVFVKFCPKWTAIDLTEMDNF